MLKQKLILLGLGAQTKYAVDINNQNKEFEIVGIVTLNKSLSDKDNKFLSKYKKKIIGYYKNPKDFLKICKKFSVKNTIICSSDLRLKFDLIKKLKKKINLINLISSQSNISNSARLGKNIIINPFASIEAMSHIKDGAMIHSSTVVCHDSIVGECALIAPGAKIAGWSTLGKFVKLYIGSLVPPMSKVSNSFVLKSGTTFNET